MNCKSIIKSGKNTGRVCNRISCNIRGHIGGMSIPEYFINVYNQNKKSLKEYFDIYKKHLIKRDDTTCKIDLLRLFSLFDTFDIEKKAFAFFFIFKLMDTPNFNSMMHKNVNKKFKNIIYEKITHLKQIRTHIPLLEYLETLELNKKYLDIKLNRLHRKKILKKYIRSTMIFYGLYRIVIEKRYRPGGIGYHECKDRFYKNCKELEKLKH